MLVIYLICFFIFPFCALFPVKSVPVKEVLLEKDDTDVIKGIAACLIILAHLIIPMKIEYSGISSILYVYTVTGGMGVLLFFFVSGYGIYKGYAEKDFTIKFWYTRIFHMYLPTVMIQFVFCLIVILINGSFDIKRILFDSFLAAWFVDVIMIQYLIFFIAWKFSKGRQNVLITLSFLGSIIVAVFFYMKEFNPRWYNGLLLFPIGMLVACKEEKLIMYLRDKWATCLCAFGIAFVFWGGVFAYGKGNYVGIDICKVLAGICLCLFICTIFIRIKFCSNVMSYIGKRSLFYYLVHLNIIGFCEKADIRSIKTFYIILILTPCIVEIFYRPYSFYHGSAIVKKIW